MVTREQYQVDRAFELGRRDAFKEVGKWLKEHTAVWSSMEAKDTVMTGKQINAEMDRIEKLDTSYTTAELELCRAQAKQTWPIAFEEGIKASRKEVGEWLKEHTAVWSNMSFNGGNMMVITLSPEFALAAINRLCQGYLPGEKS